MKVKKPPIRIEMDEGELADLLTMLNILHDFTELSRSQQLVRDELMGKLGDLEL